MKKLLALLLAALLPAMAVAETIGVTVSVKTDEDLFPQRLQTLLQSDWLAVPAEEANVYARLVHHLLNGLDVQFTIQEDAASINAAVAGTTLLDAAMYMTGTSSSITSSLFGDYMLVEEMTDADAERDAFTDAVEACDWTSISDGMNAALEQWLEGLNSVTTKGAFDGDAFEGGTWCTTWLVQDMEIAELVSAVVTEEAREAAALILNALNLDAATLLEQFDAKNNQVAKDNTYMYLVRKVGNEDSTVGYSMTIFQDNVQIATVSLGSMENGICLVVGLGMDEQNYWWEFTATVSELWNVTHYSGQSREWVADKTETFSYVSAVNVPVSEYFWQCSVTEMAESTLWNGALYQGSTAAADARICGVSGFAMPSSGSRTCSVEFGPADAAWLTLDVNLSPVDEMAPLDAALQPCSLTDAADAELLDQLAERFATLLLVRVMKVIPEELLTELNLLTLQ